MMRRFFPVVAFVAVIAVNGCNQRVAVVESPVSPTATPTAPPQQPGLASIRIDPGGVEAGDGATGMITLTGPALSPGVFVSLTSSEEATTVPATVGIVAGATFARFAVNTRRFEPDRDRVAIVTASTSNSSLSTRFETWAIGAPVFFKVFSDPEEPILGGDFRRFVPGNSTMTAVCNRNEVRLTITGRETWSVTFRGGGGDIPLHNGSFPASGVGENEDEVIALMEIRGNGRSCDAAGGYFVIEDIDLRNNRINEFHVSFTQTCRDHNGNLWGELRVVNMPGSPGATCYRSP